MIAEHTSLFNCWQTLYRRKFAIDRKKWIPQEQSDDHAVTWYNKCIGNREFNSPCKYARLLTCLQLTDVQATTRHLQDVLFRADGHTMHVHGTSVFITAFNTFVRSKLDLFGMFSKILQNHSKPVINKKHMFLQRILHDTMTTYHRADKYTQTL